MIVGVKLVSGEEIVGELVPQKSMLSDDDRDWKTGDTVTMKTPVLVLMNPTKRSNEVALGLVPFLIISDEKTVTFQGASILVRFTPKMDIQNAYRTQYGTGIQVASAADLAGLAGLTEK
jgi:hypothetical protein